MYRLLPRLLPLLLLASCAAGPGPAPVTSPAVVSGGAAPEAEAALEAALAGLEGEWGRDHPRVTPALHDLARLRAAEGRHAEAETLLRRTVAIRQAAYGPDHPEVAASLADLAWAQAGQGRLDEAVESVRRAARIRRVHVVTEATLRAGEAAPPGRSAPGPDLVAARQVALGWRLAEREPGRRAGLVDETFRAGQQVQASDVAAAVARVAARAAAGQDELAGLVREWLALVERRRLVDGRLVEAANRPAEERQRDVESGLRLELGRGNAQLTGLNGRIAQRYPEYKELTAPVPAGVEDTQRLLAADEALLAYLVLEADAAAPEQAFLWLLRRDRAAMYRLDAAPGELDASVRALRGQLDPGRWPGAEPPRFDAALAHRLYAKLLPAGARGLLAGARHLLVVPDGPLQSLPFSALVRTAPREGAGYGEVDWLARGYATTTLPSVSSLRVLRRAVPPSRAAEPFRGVGDPVLAGPDGTRRAAPVAGLLADGLADPADVRALPPLPETAGELRTLARDFGVGEGSLLLREEATERAIKAGALARARVVAFATHAGVAGELPGLAEPALVLTPPARASETDDGLLTVSEAAVLRLDADFVVLSACNTAAPDGTPGAAGLSGLAKAFVKAGSRSLLVSHWAVLSDAAERLTTGMFSALAREPSLGRAEALRRSMLALLDDPGPGGLLAHPAAWAPFVVVGEGGAPSAAGGPSG